MNEGWKWKATRAKEEYGPCMRAGSEAYGVLMAFLQHSSLEMRSEAIKPSGSCSRAPSG